MSSDSRHRQALLGKLLGAMRVWSDTDVMFSQALADQLGLNLTDLKASSMLNWTGPMPAGRMAELTGLTTGAITGVLDRLEKSGWVKRVKDPGDRRHVIIEGGAGSRAQVRRTARPAQGRHAAPHRRLR